MKMIITTIETKYTAFKEWIIQLKTLRKEKEGLLRMKSIECQKKEKIFNELEGARDLLEKCNIISRDFIKIEVEQLITQGLRSIFDKPSIKFGIEFVEKRNQTEALFSLTTEGDDTQVGNDITFEHGGGLVDIVSISLRIIIMQLLKLEGPLILDEPGKNISSQYINNFGKFLIDISKAFDRQIIMITHNSVLANCANNTISVEQKNGVSKVIIEKREENTTSAGNSR